MSNPLMNDNAPRPDWNADAMVRFADFHNNGFIANHYRWFWYVVEEHQGGVLRPELRKFDYSFLGSPGYVREKPEKCLAYIRKAVGNHPEIVNEIMALASGKPRPAIMRQAA